MINMSFFIYRKNHCDKECVRLYKVKNFGVSRMRKKIRLCNLCKDFANHDQLLHKFSERVSIELFFLIVHKT